MLVAGIMSGTSADAIDVALVKITGRGWKTRHRLVAFHSVKYAAAVRTLEALQRSMVAASEKGEGLQRRCACMSCTLPLHWP